METSNAFYQAVDAIRPTPGKIALIALDWAANTRAENQPQTEVAIEHLMRRRIPFILVSLIQYADPFMKSIPNEVATRLAAEQPGQKWEYGKDWVNFGYQPNGVLAVQGIAKATELKQQLPADIEGTAFEDLPALKGVTTIRDISMLMEFTGSVGLFNVWLQFFQVEGYRPQYVHGCTAITIPEAHIFFSSKQIVGLHEGAAGAAWYEKLLNDNYPNRKPGNAIRIMSSLAVAHLLVIGFIVLGNLGLLAQRFGGRS
jgi:hypothetical protein